MPNDPSDTPPLTHQEQKRRELKELHSIVAASQEALFATATIFPLDLFPDTVTVDRTQVTITHRSFFFMGDVISIRVEDILSVNANIGPFFGSVQLSTRYFDSSRPYHINWLWRRQALRLKALIQGLIITSRKEISISAVDAPALVGELVRLGQSTPDEAP